ncbi:Flavodoxin reductases (Ferredoxin-NADPH reductases) family 1 [Actinacidiphila bryophytorum]|uniref:Flavodoxin reductases (Ferredoxin-NADPH reductases) family 1 n=1 Tax=Actinacidiphila bryophytorum TaxID=1436133 RepID=A0A9W4GXV2_9ACTN|nr:Flavodoxin reductases (Ferredoxin-NADPH reductases) family 1 [Actinacidiphila bryophytorum]
MPATTSTETHGASSGIRATSGAAALAGRGTGRAAGGVAHGADPRLRPPRLGRPPARPARRRTVDRRGRLQHPAQLLHRLGARRRPGRTDRPARARRRGVAVSRGRPEGRRRGGDPRPGRRLVRLAAGTSGACAAGRRWLRRGPADVDDPGPRHDREQGSLPAAVLGARPRRPAVRTRTRPRRARPGHDMGLHPRDTRRLDPARRAADARRSGAVGLARRLRADLLRLRAHRLRGGRRRDAGGARPPPGPDPYRTLRPQRRMTWTPPAEQRQTASKTPTRTATCSRGRSPRSSRST